MSKLEKAKKYSPLINLIFYIGLLITTPFLLLQNYLQTFIGNLSTYSFKVWGITFPYVVLIGIIIACFLIIKNLKYFTRFSVIALLITILLMIIGQKLADFYFNHKFYELQHNWHYFAYGIFSYVSYRYFKSKNRSNSKII